MTRFCSVLEGHQEGQGRGPTNTRSHPSQRTAVGDREGDRRNDQHHGKGREHSSREARPRDGDLRGLYQPRVGSPRVLRGVAPSPRPGRGGSCVGGRGLGLDASSDGTADLARSHRRYLALGTDNLHRSASGQSHRRRSSPCSQSGKSMLPEDHRGHPGFIGTTVI